MADMPVQNYANHAKLDPPFHFFLLPVFAINFVMNVTALVRNPGLSTTWNVVLAAALVVAVFKIRIYALKVQDRVIRLEETLRLSRQLPATTQEKIGNLTESQLVALRFASDAELPALVEKTLAGNLKNAEIKKLIVAWRPDYFRV